MTDGGASAPISRRRGAALWAWLLGLLSVVLFFVPLIAPLLQGGTFAYVLYGAWRGKLDRTSVIVGAAGSALGFVLFLATEYIWIV
ncbi:MAG TPA: hypothetical protein VKF61_09790 [Candidatus Polarisedimenticolia bacterium]|nr:hypothetical protein [Candidatus Polarisedimenticolia bacterium]